MIRCHSGYLLAVIVVKVVRQKHRPDDCGLAEYIVVNQSITYLASLT